MTLPVPWNVDERVLLLALVLGSILVRSVSRWGSWGIRSRPGRAGRLAYRVRRLEQYPLLREIVRWIFYLGVPYAALLAGILNPHVLGVTLPDQSTWQPLVFFGALFAALLGASWWHYSRVHPTRATPHITDDWRGDVFGWARLWPDITLHQMHWAFYRALPVAYVTGFAGPFLGVVLVLIEWGMDPLWWRALTRPRLLPPVALRLAMLVISAFGFAVSGSSLPGLALHLVWEPALFAIALPADRTPPASPPKPEQNLVHGRTN